MAVGINPYNAPRAAEKEKKESDFDRVMKGVQVAGSLYGIYADVQKLGELRKQNEMDTEKLGLARQQNQFEQEQATLQSHQKQEQLDEDKRRYEKDYGLRERMAAAEEMRARKAGGAENSLAHEIQRTRLEGMKREQERGTPDQNKVALFAQRTLDAEKIFDELGSQGYDGTGFGAEAQRSGFVPERMKSDEFKKLEQAQRNFINATLRRESGASISPQEFESAAKQYFPQPGDSAEVLKQKKENRMLVSTGLSQEAGNAFANLQRTSGRDANTAGTPVQIDMNRRGGLSVLSPPAANAAPMGPAGPKAGAVEGGYRFKGGDPADQKNWEKVK